MATKSGRPQSFAVQVPLGEAPEDAPKIAAYLFDRSGRLIDAALIEKEQARFSLEQVPEGARLRIGPAIDSNLRVSRPTIELLDRLNAYAPDWRFDPGKRLYQLPPIPPQLWPLWILCWCKVRGRVVKEVTMADGEVVEVPVCNARVNICEADPLYWIIQNATEAQMRRIVDELLRLDEEPETIPPKGPVGPKPDPSPLDEGALGTFPQHDDVVEDAVRLIAGSPGQRQEARLSQQAVSSAGLRARRTADGGRLLSPATRLALSSRSNQIARQALIANLDLIKPLLCGWPWAWPWFYKCDKLTSLITDHDGRFEVWIPYLCNGDKPDLYFSVDYSIGGVWTSVHKPPMACNIWWNYPCGTEVKITVTDPRVHGCYYVPPVPGKQVVVKTIGRRISMGEINREPSPANPGGTWGLAGTAVAGEMNLTKEAPFGGELQPRVDFGQGLKAAGINWYRWSYRPLGSSGGWTVIDKPVRRYYREPAGPNQPIVYKLHTIGPAPGISGFYVEIDPALPAGAAAWEPLNEYIDLASAHWDTTALAPGKYELKLELFKKDGSGNMQAVNLTAAGVDVFQILDPAPLTAGTYVSSPATHDRVMLDGSGDVAAFRLVLHVDNRPCYGTIESVTVAPGSNDTKCGFLEYGQNASATISFRASHPANFATFSFAVVRVATPLPSAGASGLVEDSNVNGYVRSGNLFSKAVTVTTLLEEGLPPNETPCIRAAFAESLRVYALATDGYGRLSHLDAPNGPGQIGLRAFAITPV